MLTVALSQAGLTPPRRCRFALVNINQFKKATVCLERAEEIARLSGNEAQASFVATFVASTRARALVRN